MPITEAEMEHLEDLEQAQSEKLDDLIIACNERDDIRFTRHIDRDRRWQLLHNADNKVDAAYAALLEANENLQKAWAVTFPRSRTTTEPSEAGPVKP